MFFYYFNTADVISLWILWHHADNGLFFNEFLNCSKKEQLLSFENYIGESQTSAQGGNMLNWFVLFFVLGQSHQSLMDSFTTKTFKFQRNA